MEAGWKLGGQKKTPSCARYIYIYLFIYLFIYFPLPPSEAYKQNDEYLI
jgi:hypothetical protein